MNKALFILSFQITHLAICSRLLLREFSYPHRLIVLCKMKVETFLVHFIWGRLSQ